MESFPYVNGSYNSSSDTLHASSATWLVSRLLCRCFGPHGRSSLYPEENLSPESGPCAIVLSDQDSSIFQSYVEPLLEWELEPYDWTIQDFSSSAAFLDWEVPGDSEPADPQGCTPDIILEDGDLEGALWQTSQECGLVNERLRFLAAGFAIHFIGFCLFISVPTSLPKGLGGISDKPIFVRIPVRLEIDTPDIPSNASADSPGSMASLARRHPKPKERKAREESRKELASEVEPKNVTEKPENESRPMDAKLAEEPVPIGEKIPPDVSVQDGPPNDSKNLQDSVASMPSVASPERKGSLKAGDEAESYKDKILSAIHQAAYYPRAALRKMACGKAVVSFTINKDGSLAKVSIVGHTESETLDEAALKIVQQASSRFPPIPDELMKDEVTYVVPIVFKKRG
ncbi:MAG: energy transducer TonB [Desulfomonile tiedjei]|uniref:Energy transducer TonB n=1 Tax=Desulfomonile tiedjei TaxID=2358 RepID=A0A9D6V197_9BACT|nr:energy transducer TonB [Desulfomonile tiedjei]